MKPTVSDLEVSIEALISDVADDFAARLARGEKPRIAEYVKEHPQHARIIEQVLGSVAVMQSFDLDPKFAGQLTKSQDTTQRTLGDYRIIREIGHGGMGTVYEAQQLSMDRRVALKVLPFAALLDDRQLRRFKNEARTAGTLHHPHIVPIYSVGLERGVHYYAMQYIEGPSLAEVLNDLVDQEGGNARDVTSEVWNDPPTATSTEGRASSNLRERSELTSNPIGDTRRELQAFLSTARSSSPRKYFEEIAKWGTQACDALAHAHESGVLHRDIKPGNLLVDERGDLWVTDFGLARLEKDASITASGDVLGTVRYMAPEQALGKRVLIDHRADIYSLGVTLYELVALEPAFSGEDRESLLRSVALDEPVPPRKHSANIPSDMETIVLKAIEKRPDDRYQTAEEFAADLQRFLEARPVLAKRPGITEHARKWARRHQAIVVAALIMLILATAGLATSTWLISQQSHKAIQATQAAQANFELAQGAVDRFLTRISEEELLNAPQMEHLRERLLTDALEFYQTLSNRRGDSPGIRLETALARQRLGEVLLQLGNRREADDAMRIAVNELRDLATDFPDEPNYLVPMANAARAWFVRQITRERTRAVPSEQNIDEPIDLLDDVTQRLEQFLERHPGHRECQLALAEIFVRRGGYFANDRHLLGKAKSLAEELNRRTAPQPEERLLLAKALTGPDTMHDPPGAKASFQRAIHILEGLLEEFPKHREYREELARTYSNFVVVCARESSTEQRKTLERSVQLYEELARDFPAVLKYRSQAAMKKYGLGLALAGMFGWSYPHEDLAALGEVIDAAAAEEQFLAGEQMLLELQSERPDLADYVNMLGRVYRELATFYRFVYKADTDEFLHLSGRRTRLLLAAAEQFDQPEYRVSAGWSRFAEAAWLLDRGKLAAALEAASLGYSHFREAIEAADSLGISATRASQWCRDFGGQCSSLAERLYDTGYADEAADYVRKSILWRRRAQEISPDHVRNRIDLANLLVTWPQPEFRNVEEAQQLVNTAIAELDVKPEGYPAHWETEERSDCWQTLGLVHLRQEGWQEAIEAMKKSSELREESLRAGGGYEWFVMAISHWQLGNRDEARMWYDKAAAWLNDKTLLEQSPNDYLSVRVFHDFRLRHLRTEAEQTLGLSSSEDTGEE